MLTREGHARVQSDPDVFARGLEEDEGGGGVGHDDEVQIELTGFR